LHVQMEQTQSSAARSLVEELMLAAGEAAAHYAHSSALPFLYRAQIAGPRVPDALTCAPQVRYHIAASRVRTSDAISDRRSARAHLRCDTPRPSPPRKYCTQPSNPSKPQSAKHQRLQPCSSLEPMPYAA
jgi:hypothetical protein